MRILVLGGTAFVGRAIVVDALARGWEVTTLNRGTAASVEGARALVGDRTERGGLAAIEAEHGHWDVVVDTWAKAPAVVAESANLLADRADVYAYVSSRSVYRWPSPAGADESSDLVEADPHEQSGDDYARAKRGAELAVEQAFDARHVFARAGLILGPWSNIGRLPWWLDRIARGGDVLAPGPPDLPLQFIDARDLAAWLLSAATSDVRGAFDIVSPSGHATMASLLAACIEATGEGTTGDAPGDGAAGDGAADGHTATDANGPVRLHWVDPDDVVAAGIDAWTELPIWAPPGELHDALHRSDVGKAMAAGLAPRPVEETVSDTWTWMESFGGLPPTRPGLPPHGLAPDRERQVLASRGAID